MMVVVADVDAAVGGVAGKAALLLHLLVNAALLVLLVCLWLVLPRLMSV